MKKTYLISYAIEKFQALNSNGTTYIVELKVIWLWGLINKTILSKYTIPDHANFNSYIDNWDNLIKTKQPI